MQNQQKTWLDQQLKEKRQQQDRDRQEERLYAQQILEVTRMRGMLEDEFAQKKTDMTVAQKDLNQDLVAVFNQAREKRDREERERLEKLEHERQEVRILLERGVKKPYP